MDLEFSRPDGSRVLTADVVATIDYVQGLSTLEVLDPHEALRLGEPRLQLLEGCQYEYQLNVPGYFVKELAGVVRRSRIAIDALDRGIISASLYVGTLYLILVKADGTEVGQAAVEVRSRKVDYRTEFRDMLSDIAEWATDLIGSMSGIAHGQLQLSEEADAKTLQQRYYLVKSILSSSDFRQAVLRVIATPHSKLQPQLGERDVRRGVRPTARAQREIASKQRRITVPLSHPMSKAGISSLPAKISFSEGHVTFDTPENRFVRYILTSSQRFIIEIRRLYAGSLCKPTAPQLATVADMDRLISILNEWLLKRPFSDCESVVHLNCGSPVLQRRAGYRELLRFWIILQLGAQLGWSGGDFVFEGTRKNVATLYEYWCFIKIASSVGQLIDLPSDYGNEFITTSRSGLELMLSKGEEVSFIGHTCRNSVDLSVQLSYNQTFQGSSAESGQSWTREMRPDVTLAIWPRELTKDQAQDFGLISLIHFDAKYKSIISSFLAGAEADDPDITYNRDDLAKMHAYRDAIRRSEAAYILFPGNKITKFEKFGEVLPGLGAIPLIPGDASGPGHLFKMLNEVLDNCALRSSKRAELAFAESKVKIRGSYTTKYAPLPLGPDSKGALEVKNPSDNLVFIYIESAGGEIVFYDNYTEIVLDLEYIPHEIIADGVRDRLIFALTKSGQEILMRVVAVDKISGRAVGSKVVMSCKIQEALSSSALMNWLSLTARDQKGYLAIYHL